MTWSLRCRRNAIVKDVIYHVDRLTEPFGGAGAYDRSDQPSHHRVADEIQQMGSMAFVTPSIFLAVSTFLFNIVLSRMVHHQKEQIATLRAFGYGPREIGLYYVKFLVVLVTVGAVIGCLAGLPLSWWMTDMYVRFFRFPIVKYEFGWVMRSWPALGIGSCCGGKFRCDSPGDAIAACGCDASRSTADFQRSILERIGLAAIHVAAWSHDRSPFAR